MNQHYIFLLQKIGFKVVFLFFSLFSFMIVETKAAEVTICLGETLYLGTVNRGDSATYFWSGPNGFTSTEQNLRILNVTLAHSGNYVVEITIGGTVIATETTVVRVGGVIANFDVPGDQFAIGQPIPFTDLSEGAASWSWDFGNGQTSNTQNPQYTYPVYGSYAVSLTIYDSSSYCTGAYQKTIQVIYDNVIIPDPVTITCNQYIMDAGGNDRHPHNADEVFSIVSNNGANVLVEFLMFELGEGDQFCIYDGTTTSSPLIGCYTENNTPQNIVSAGDALTFHFISDSVDAGPGWIAKISCFENCNNNGPLCEGATLELRYESEKTGLVYQWSGPDNFSSTERYPTIGNVTAGNAGVYTVILTLNDDTLAIDSTMVEIYPTPELTITHSSLAICNGDTVILRASGASQYQWSNSLGNDTLVVITPTSSGTYSVTGTVNGCSSTENISITVPAQLTASITPIVTPPCSDANVLRIVGHVNGGSPPYSYQWSGLGILDVDSMITQFSTDRILCDSSIIVRFVAHDTNGCEISAQNSMTFRENQPPLISGSLATAPADNTGEEYAIPDLTTVLQSTTTDNCTSSADILITQNPPQGSAIVANTMVAITATDRCGNSASVSTEVIVPQPLVATIVNRTNMLCHGDHAGLLIVSASGGVQPYRYQWNTTPSQIGDTASNLPAGIYSVTVTDADNRQIVVSETVTQPEMLEMDFLPVHTTCGNPNGEVAASVSGGTPPYRYLWSNGETEAFIPNCAAGNYSLTVTDTNGCFISDNVTIDTSTLFTITLLAEANTNCQHENGIIEIGVNDGVPPYQFNWSNGQVTQNLHHIPSGTYSVTVTDENLCTVEFSHTITDFSPVVSIVAISPEYCGRQDGWVLIEVNGNLNDYTIDWQSVLNFKGDSAFNLSAGNYTVTVVDGDCEITFDFTIPHIDASVADFSLSHNGEHILPGTSLHFIDQSIQASRWHWDFGDGRTSNLQNPYHEYAVSGDYITMLTIIDDNECIDTASMKIEVQDASAIYIPNAFSPGSNGENAIFRPVLHNIMSENYSLSIYDRYGRLIFRTTNTSEGWDGTVDGNPIPAATVSVYIIQYQSNDKKKYIKRGTVVAL